MHITISIKTITKTTTNPLIIEDLADNKSQLFLNLYLVANFVT